MNQLRKVAVGGIAFVLLTSVALADLRFTEYVEGSSFNKALEIYNDTGAPVNLSGYEVRIYFNGSTSAGNTISLTGTVNHDDVFVLAHGSANSAILLAADQTNSASWFNGDDAVELANGITIIDVIGQVGFDPGSAWGSAPLSTQNSTLRRQESVTMGDNNGSDAFDPALEWVGFSQDTVNGLGFYPGTGGGGTTPMEIYEIQGATHDSPAAGITVETTGIVTAVDSNGFYLQHPVGDGDDDTSDGIFVFTGGVPTVAIGDDVEVTGSVTEFFPGGVGTGNLSITEIVGPTTVIASSGNPLPAPVVLGNAGRLPPSEIIDNDQFAVFDPTEDGIDFYEAVEGMLVTIDDALAVSPTNRFGEIYTVSDNGSFATSLSNRGTITVVEGDFNPERIQVQLDNDLVPGITADVATGATLGDVTGVVGYGFGNFEVKPTQPLTVTPSGLTPETTTLTGDASHLTVATYNILNLEPNPTDGDDDVGDGQFDAIAGHIVHNTGSPDIVAVQEIQDNDGASNTGVVDATLTYQILIASINAAGGPAYDFFDIPPVNNQDGGQPGGNIRNGYLYQPARVSFVNGFRVLDPDLGDGDAFANSRKPIYAEFDFNGESLHLINVHYTSKGGGTPLFGAVQPAVNGSTLR